MTSAQNIIQKLSSGARLCALALLLTVMGVSSSSGFNDQGYMDDTECGPGELALATQTAFSQAELARDAIANAQATETVVESTKGFMQAPRAWYTPDLWCLNDIIMYFDIINGLIAAGNAIEAAIIGAVIYFANAVCDAVTDAVMNTINNALDKVCIPLPDMIPSMSGLPSVERKTCNGKSLRDLMWVEAVPGLDTSAFMPRELLSAPLSRWVNQNGIGQGVYSIRRGAVKP